MSKLPLIVKARYLRQEETKAEKILWEQLRNNKLGIKFRRQHPIGSYVLDFYAPSLGLAIELDGDVHRESKEYDKERTKYLSTQKIQVVRFWNKEVEQDLANVLNQIKKTANT